MVNQIHLTQYLIMASAAYIEKFRKLKKIYCEEYGVNISDVTWYKISAQIRKYLGTDFNKPEAESVIRTIASLKKRHRNFRINSDEFPESMRLFSHFKQMNKKMTCAEFLCDLASMIDVTKVSRASRYVWFCSSGIPFRLDTEYHTNDFAFVAFRAAKSIRNKHQSHSKMGSEIMKMKRLSIPDELE